MQPKEIPAGGGLYIRGLDGIRALSIALVFFSHLGFPRLSPGMFGVNAFFLLSGFLITTLMIREQAARGRVSIREFYVRRILRIFPPMYLVILFGVLVVSCGIMPATLKWSAVLAQCFHLTNYFEIFRGGTDLIPGLGVYWSLAVEEHYYLLFPLIFVLGYRRLGARRLAAALAAVAVLVLAWRIILVVAMQVGNPDRTAIATDTRIDSILWGCALALWRNPALEPARARPLASAWICAAALAVLAFTLVWHNPVFRETARYTIESLCLIPLLCAAVLRQDWAPVRLLETPLMRWLGRISYTFYLCHFLFIQIFVRNFPNWPRAALIVAALACTLAFAEMMRRTVEKPLGRVRKRHGGA